MRPTVLEVNLPQLKKNLEAIRSHVSPASVMLMVKANAYGHGIEGVAPYIEPFVDYFGVALPEEGVYLRTLGMTKPILVAGGTLPEQLPLFIAQNFTLTGSSIELLEAAEEAAKAAGKRIKTHLKIDTGMERVGVREYEAEELIERSLKLKYVDVEGIYSHLANSELSDRKYSAIQVERFNETLNIYEKRSERVPAIRHVNNSGGILNLPQANFDLVRPGVLFYGIYPGEEVARVVNVQPALTWRTRVAYSKRTKPGRPISYGSLWQADQETRIVTVPCGYADGYFRRMTNQARVMVNGRLHPQVGRICMDQFMVSVGQDDVKVGDDVILLGGEITVYDLAAWAGTNEYEVMTNISARVPRVYVFE